MSCNKFSTPLPLNLYNMLWFASFKILTLKCCKFKLLEHNPTPSLKNMIDFAQRYGAMEGYFTPEVRSTSVTASVPETLKYHS